MKRKDDAVDTWIKSINWKVGGFNVLPVVFGMLMATLDILMMSLSKMIHNGTLSSGIGIPLSIGIYACEPLIFLKAMNYESMTAMNLIWDLSSDILVTLNGLFVFKESIKGLRWLAICFSVFSLGLMAYTGKD
jgi:hypothetical protein